MTTMHDWPGVAAPQIDRWILSADLGQTGDPTAITVAHHVVTPLDRWTPIREREYWKQERTETIDALHIERLPLNMSYVDQVRHIRTLLIRPPFDRLKPDFLIDSTGVGKGVADLFDALHVKPIRVTISSGLETNQHGAYEFTVPKQELISSLDAAMHSSKLRIASKLREADALRNEFVDFERKITASGRATYAARATAHDDLVLSLSMVTWWCAYRQRNVTTHEELHI